MTSLRIFGILFVLLGYVACVGTDIGNPASSQMASANEDNFGSESPGSEVGEADEGAMSHDADTGDMGPDVQLSDLSPDMHRADRAVDLQLEEFGAQDTDNSGDVSHVELESGD
jgi:hypothetical protein